MTFYSDSLSNILDVFNSGVYSFCDYLDAVAAVLIMMGLNSFAAFYDYLRIVVDEAIIYYYSVSVSINKKVI